VVGARSEEYFKGTQTKNTGFIRKGFFFEGAEGKPRLNVQGVDSRGENFATKRKSRRRGFLERPRVRETGGRNPSGEKKNQGGRPDILTLRGKPPHRPCKEEEWTNSDPPQPSTSRGQQGTGNSKKWRTMT